MTTACLVNIRSETLIFKSFGFVALKKIERELVARSKSVAIEALREKEAYLKIWCIAEEEVSSPNGADGDVQQNRGRDYILRLHQCFMSSLHLCFLLEYQQGMETLDQRYRRFAPSKHGSMNSNCLRKLIA